MVTADFEKRWSEPVEISRSFSGGSVDEAVYAKMDWLTLVYKDCKTNEILVSLGFNGSDFDEIERAFSERVMRSTGYLTDLTFTINGINFSYRYGDVVNKVGALNMDDLNMYDFFDLQLEYIRIDMSGSGLDWLRSIGIDVDTNYRDHNVLSLEGELDVHCTRVDSAFDFVNYKPSFLNDYIAALKQYGNPVTGVVPIAKSPTNGLKYSIREGIETTVYLGTGKSDKLLRIYDKLKQYENSGKMANCPYVCNGELPFSWFRIELQCRREPMCHKVLFGGDMTSTLRFIDESFAIVNKERKKSLTWVNLFDWESLPRIIQNAKYVQIQSRRDRAERYVKNTAIGNIGIFVAHNGINALIKLLEDWLSNLQLSDNPIDIKRWQNFRCALLSDSLTYPEFFVRDSKGIYKFKL